MRGLLIGDVSISETLNKSRQKFVIAGWTLKADDLSGASFQRKLATGVYDTRNIS